VSFGPPETMFKHNYRNQEYNVRLSIGTPAQVFEMLPDTSGGNTWVTGTNCDSNNPYYVSDIIHVLNIIFVFLGLSVVLSSESKLVPALLLPPMLQQFN
jgi:hypothetical protein